MHTASLVALTTTGSRNTVFFHQLAIVARWSGKIEEHALALVMSLTDQGFCLVKVLRMLPVHGTRILGVLSVECSYDRILNDGSQLIAG